MCIIYFKFNLSLKGGEEKCNIEWQVVNESEVQSKVSDTFADSINQIIVSTYHQIAKFIIKDYHKQYLHVGWEQTLVFHSLKILDTSCPWGSLLCNKTLFILKTRKGDRGLFLCSVSVSVCLFLSI